MQQKNQLFKVINVNIKGCLKMRFMVLFISISSISLGIYIACIKYFY